MTEPGYIECPFCREEIKQQAVKCKHCQTMLHQNPDGQQQPSMDAKGNPLAIWGFFCALFGLLLPVPFIDLVISLAGGIISIIAVRNQNLLGFSIAGIVIGVIGFIGAIVLLATEPEFYGEVWKLIGGIY